MDCQTTDGQNNTEAGEGSSRNAPWQGTLLLAGLAFALCLLASASAAGPVAEFSHPAKWPVNVEVEFRDFSHDLDGNVTWSWDFDAADGIQVDSIDRNPLHAYPDAGIYTVTLTATNTTGSTDTTTSEITVAAATLQDWAQQSKNQADDVEAHDSFGSRVSIHGDTALIGASGEDTGGNGAGAAYIFTRTGTTWTQQAKLQATDKEAYDSFGRTVSLHSNTALIGAPFENTGGTSAGAAYIFTRTGTTWTQQTKLQATDTVTYDIFGGSVSIHGDTALIGADGADTTDEFTGAAYVFTRTGTAWTQQAKLQATDGEPFDDFGESVSLHGDTALISAPEEDTGGNGAGAAYIFTRTGTTWTQQAKLQATDPDGEDEFGSSVSIHGDTALIGASLDDTVGDDAGAAYIFTRTGTTWTQQAKLQADDGEFGESVSIHGDTALIGAPFEDTGGSNAGAAYVFTRTGTTWTQQTKLQANDKDSQVYLGSAVSIHGDTALIGATGAGVGGAAYFFELPVDCAPTAEFDHPAKWPVNVEVEFRDFSHDLEGNLTREWDFDDADGIQTDAMDRNPRHTYTTPGTYTITLTVTDTAGNTHTTTSGITIAAATLQDWAQQSKNQADDAEANDEFGYSASIHGDTAIIGAIKDDTGGSFAGAAYIFTHTGTTWTQQAKLQANDLEAGDRFGWSASLHGNTALIGAHLEDTGAPSAGAAYIFTRTGTTWTQQAKLQANDREAGDRFGSSVSLHGNTALIGANNEDTGGTNAGAAYIFTRTGTTWTQQTKLQATDNEANDWFGSSVSLHGDTALIGAYLEDTGEFNAGAAYIFTRTGTAWTQQTKLQANDREAGDWFGYSVSLHGNTALIGAIYEGTGGTNAGAAYIFTRTGTTWTQQAKLQTNDLEAGDFLGVSVSIHGNTALIGTPFEDTGGNAAGAAYIFTRTGTAWTQQTKLQANDVEALDQFGWSASIHGDTALIGAPEEGTGAIGAGAAYFFELAADCKPIAAFSRTPGSGGFQMTDESTDPEGTIVAWEWKVNGVVASTAQNPLLNARPGDVVSLNITDAGGNTDTASEFIPIRGGGNPTYHGYKPGKYTFIVNGEHTRAYNLPVWQYAFRDGIDHRITEQIKDPRYLAPLPDGFDATFFGLDLEISPPGEGYVVLALLQSGIDTGRSLVLMHEVEDGSWVAVPVTTSTDGRWLYVKADITAGPFSNFVLAYGEAPDPAEDQQSLAEPVAPDEAEPATDPSVTAAGAEQGPGRERQSPGVSWLALLVLAGAAVLRRR